MKRVQLLLSLMLIVFCTGCVSAPKKATMFGATDRFKSAPLNYTDIGLTSAFEFKGIATGTYKSFAYQAGLIYHAGSQNIKLTVNAAEKWAVKAESKRRGIVVPGISLRLHNPYIGTITRKGKTIGTIGIDMPTLDKTKEVLKFVGINKLIHRNLHLKGQARILGKKYVIASVYENPNGEKSSSPKGYKVLKGKKTVGLIQVGQNLTGGQSLHLWVDKKLSSQEEQSVVATLLVCGYAI